MLYKKNGLKPKPDSHEDEDVISAEKLTPASTSAVIQSDKRDNEQFDSTQGIPTSETQYVNVFTDSYLYKYRFVRKYGKSNLTIILAAATPINMEIKNTIMIPSWYGANIPIGRWTTWWCTEYILLR